MKSPAKFRWIRGFQCAFAGLGFAWRTQRNVRVHALIATVVAAAGLGFGISRLEWLALVLATGFVLASELLNTALEVLADRVTSEHDEAIGRAKDVAAAGVLVAVFAAVAVGLAIFGPRVLTSISVWKSMNISAFQGA